MTAENLLNREPLAYLILTSVARTAKGPNRPVPYAPATWLDVPPNDRNRARWSRLVRRMETLSLIRRHVDDSRDRVRKVSITPEGWNWIIETCGAGAFLNLDELCQP